MSDTISSLVSSFISFISQNDKQLKHHPGGVLISFAALLDRDILSDTILISRLIKTSSRAFYFEHPDDKYAFLGLNECVSINENGIGRFALTDKKAAAWEDKFINNWDTVNGTHLPLFVGAMKFSAEHTDEIWKDYDDSSWFIPETLLVRVNDKCYIIFNNVIHKNFDKSQLTDKLNKICSKLEGTVVNRYTGSSVIRDEITSVQKEKKKWKQLISNAIDDILDKKVQKIVYSRKSEYLLSDEIEVNKIIDFYRQQYSACYIFIYRKGSSVFFGATPEKLARFFNNSIEVDSLAGSAPRGKNLDEDEKIASELLKNNKNLVEHDFVTEHIKSIIRKFSPEIEIGKLTIKKLSNIQHLWTRISAKLNNNVGIFSVINELFPTPAVCGEPRKQAMELIKRNELHNRGLYAGFTGWFNLKNEGEFVVSIRSAIAKANKLYAFAGCGIVADSDPEEEFKETELKLNPIISIFRDENKN